MSISMTLNSKWKKNRQRLLDNCPSHKNVNKYSYIDIVYLPSNVTSVFQPMEAGIIVSLTLKLKYKTGLVMRLQ